MGELYELQTSSPVTSRAHQACSAVTGAMGYGPFLGSPILKLIETDPSS